MFNWKTNRWVLIHWNKRPLAGTYPNANFSKTHNVMVNKPPCGQCVRLVLLTSINRFKFVDNAFSMDIICGRKNRVKSKCLKSYFKLLLVFKIVGFIFTILLQTKKLQCQYFPISCCQSRVEFQRVNRGRLCASENRAECVLSAFHTAQILSDCFTNYIVNSFKVDEALIWHKKTEDKHA